MCLKIYNNLYKKNPYAIVTDRIESRIKKVAKDTPDPYTADTNILCYKVLRVRLDHHIGPVRINHYRGPYYSEFEYQINTPMHTDDFKVYTEEYINNAPSPSTDPSVTLNTPDYNIKNYWCRDGYLCISKGFHSFKRKNDAKKECDDWTSRLTNRSDSFVVAKCCIPTGSKYYLGINEIDGTIGYCSEDLVILEIL